MEETQLRTPGIWMTEQQCLQVLDDLQVVHVFKPEGGKIMLTIAVAGGGETLAATELKSRMVGFLAELEDRKREIEENAFASVMDGNLPTGADRSVSVKYLKRDDQLTPEEEEQKRKLLREIGKEISRHRTVIGAMNFLQIHFKELLPRLLQRELPLEMAGLRSDGTKARWTKGIKSAALFCLKESEKKGNLDKSQLEICKDFLAHFTIDEEEGYSPEQLYRNMQQIVLLDRAR
jgi:hypothetical protein